jgi:hypothetical protein
MSKQPARRRRVVRAFAPAVGLLAAGLLVWQGSYAAFSATTPATNNAWSAGSLALANNGGAAAYSASANAVFGGTTLKPGANGAASCLTVNSTGNLAGSLRMYLSSITDSTPSLGSQIKVTIDEAPTASDVLANCATFPTTGVTNVANGVALTALPTTFAGAAAPVAVAAGNVKVAYRLSWTFATIGTNASDSALMGKSVSADFTWEIQ